MTGDVCAVSTIFKESQNFRVAAHYLSGLTFKREAQDALLSQVRLGEINIVLPCANSMSVAQPAKVGALIVRLSECTMSSAAGAACSLPSQLAVLQNCSVSHDSNCNTGCQAGIEAVHLQVRHAKLMCLNLYRLPSIGKQQKQPQWEGRRVA